MSWFVPTGRLAALHQLVLSRFRLFLREPAAVFWVYGFPILIVVALGLAFRDDPRETIAVDVVGSGDLAAWQSVLAVDQRFQINLATADWQARLQSGKTDLVIEVDDEAPGGFRLWQEPRRAESRLARWAVETMLLRGKTDGAHEPDVAQLEQTGSRYIDFLLPGMIGLGLMGGGLWGVGFVVVDMRVRKLLKRFVATPMRHGDFLASIMLSRLVFTLADVLVLLVFGYLVFNVSCQGSFVDLVVTVLLGGAAFAGIGLLVASRAETLESISGLMNLVMLPMWVLSGVFFSSERFPEGAQPLINLLPLTALNQLLRGIMLEGQSLQAFVPQTLLLTAYTAVSFVIALCIFRWK